MHINSRQINKNVPQPKLNRSSNTPKHDTKKVDRIHTLTHTERYTYERTHLHAVYKSRWFIWRSLAAFEIEVIFSKWKLISGKPLHENACSLKLFHFSLFYFLSHQYFIINYVHNEIYKYFDISRDTDFFLIIGNLQSSISMRSDEWKEKQFLLTVLIFVLKL